MEGIIRKTVAGIGNVDDQGMEDVEKFLRCLMSKRSPCNGDIKWGGGRSIQTRFFSLSRKKQCHVFVSGG